MKIDRSGTCLLGVEINLPELAQRIGLDEVSLVVHMEPAVDGLALHVGDEPGHVDDCHVAGHYRAEACPLPRTNPPSNRLR
jgi:hypothetical protein